MVRFSAEDDDKLVETVSKFPNIYDNEDINYKSFIKKENGWKAIAKEVGKSSHDCKKRWRNIKDCYFRHKRKMKLGTHSSIADKPIKWSLFTHLSFLDNVKQGSQYAGDNGEVPQDNSHEWDSVEESSLHQSPLDVISCTLSSNKRQKLDSKEQETISSVSSISLPIPHFNPKCQCTKNLSAYEERAQVRMEILESLQNKAKEDDVDLFMKSISLTVKNLPPELISEAKLGILTLVTNLQSRANHSYNSHSSSLCQSGEIQNVVII